MDRDESSGLRRRTTVSVRNSIPFRIGKEQSHLRMLPPNRLGARPLVPAHREGDGDGCIDFDGIVVEKRRAISPLADGVESGLDQQLSLIHI